MSKLVKKELTLDEIRPYWRNPRVMTEEGVLAVATSIREYGYNQPIVIDEENVIVIGHTRYAALRKLRVQSVEVMVVKGLTPGQVKQLRVIDNRAAEFALWDFEKLTQEIQGMDASLLEDMFPEIADWNEDDEERMRRLVEQDEDEAQTAWDSIDSEVEFVCPSCFHEWVQEVTREEIMRGRLEELSDATA